MMRLVALLLAALLLGISTMLLAQTIPVLQPSQSAPVLRENLTAFDYRSAEVEWQDGRWQIRAGSVWLKDFGRQERDAREALNVIRDLRLTQYGTVGAARPVIEYWLADGRAPAAGVSGLR